MVVDFERGDAKKGGAAIPLAAKEFELLRYLVNRRGKAVSREELLESVWEYQPGVSSRTLDVHIALLGRNWKTIRQVRSTFTP
jgi:DNA-binding response OmpR family regulator